MYPENLLAHNWLAKKLINRFVAGRLPSLRGIVIDLGCGTRPFERDILRYADHYMGVDWANSMHGLKADVLANLNMPLPLADDVADHVISLEVMEHLSEPDVMLAEAFRVLRRGGELTISTPFQWWIHEAPWDFQRFTRFGLEHHLTKAGFTDIIVRPTSGFWAMWVLKFNYQLHRLVRGPRLMRTVVRAILSPFWLTNQIIALNLDHVWPEDRETVGYFTIARKP
ncbi:class I SAM-dependent methyltransferase [Dyella sp. ASV21]|uniref:class I SAM-dependent methyltransferase n=1 Tax=Dyella sp. ASV21 TaxID=2795114 RepID=UPI0018EBA9F3|nr:class I SAM-dependent methyltransferase [Dyella sp. ASV21]